MNVMKSLLPALPLFVVVACGGSVYSVGSDQSGEKGTTSSGGSSGGAADASPACTKDADCGAGYACGFAESDACNATGRCFDVSGKATCAAYEAGCACDGTEINIACTPYPQGYVSKPLHNVGKCTGGAADASAPCVTTADCPQGLQCGYDPNAACNARGVCYAVEGPICNSVILACGCDGTDAYIACGSSYASKPIAHYGKCGDGG
jgi:hypothetical protein